MTPAQAKIKHWREHPEVFMPETQTTPLPFALVQRLAVAWYEAVIEQRANPVFDHARLIAAGDAMASALARWPTAASE